MKAFMVLTILMLFAFPGSRAESLDIAVNGYGMSIGNSSRFTGLRIKAVDRGVRRIDGINVTLWNPDRNPEGEYNGVALGLIGTKARAIRGLALSGIGVNAGEEIEGVAAGALGVGTARLTGVAAGLITVDVRERLRGVGLAGLWSVGCEQVDGLLLSGGGVVAKSLRGGAIGLLAGGERDLAGLAFGLGGFFSARFRGVGVGGLGGGGEDLKGLFATGLFLGSDHLDGIALTLGGMGGKSLDGIMLAGLGLGASEHIRGIALGGALVFAPEVTGFAAGALNGLYIDRIDLEDFLHFNLANRSFTGLSLGLVNYTARLRGVQLGLLNYAGNNPPGLRLLPLINVHL